MLVPGCANVLTPSEASLPPNFVEDLKANGQLFTSTQPPAGVVEPQVVVSQLNLDGFPPFAPAEAEASQPVYGIVACRNHARCTGRGVMFEGRPTAIWLVVWPGVAGGNSGQAWAAVDPTTGSFLVGDGPPGP